MNRREIIKTGGLAMSALALPIPLSMFTKFNKMEDKSTFEIIIIGGSYAGLSAAMALGRSLRDVLIIDSGLPCNRQTPHSHNLITQDGEKPQVIAEKSKAQVLKYDTVKFLEDLAVDGRKTENGFEITTQKGGRFQAKKLIFATGVKDNMPNIKGFSECWGISVIHCPYCHGYEVKNQKTGILANGDAAFHYAQLINHWTKDLTIYTNGKADFNDEQLQKFEQHNISIHEKEIASLDHKNGQLEHLTFNDNSIAEVKAIYARPDFEQHCKIPEMLGCEFTEEGHIKVDFFQKTSEEGVFAIGDSTTPFRSVAYAISAGNIAGAVLNNAMIEEDF